ncbi:Rossmann-fold NAD(P)-binding domain-containing protein [Streptomyces lasiicapitis]|uniref:alanine dehydrogenase n=1 Tax=Streptomyces lasiicapitis TaxID=1923961 RepID=UPI00364E29EB
MPTLTVGVITTPHKDSDQRLPIHPQHLAVLEAEIRSQLYFEAGYGTPFGTTDHHLARQSGGTCTREEIFSECDVILLHKPSLPDLNNLREQQILWGSPYFTQNDNTTRTTTDQRLALITAEPTPHTPGNRSLGSPIGPPLDEMAGYSSVTHALACIGRTGRWGPPLRAVVIGHEAAGKGALKALRAQGLTDITLVTTCFPATLDEPLDAVHKAQLVVDDSGKLHAVSATHHTELAELLSCHDVIVDCLRQDTGAPLTFLTKNQTATLEPGTLIVDVLRDHGTGFGWTRPTTLTHPLHQVTDSVRYYAVKDSPAHLWNSATWLHSTAILPHLGHVVTGEARWDLGTTPDRTNEVRSGAV